MYFLRTLSIGDVVRALKQRELRLALRISQNLISNAISTARSQARRRSSLPIRRVVRRAS